MAFKKINTNANGQTPSSGQELVDAFNENFSSVPELDLSNTDYSDFLMSIGTSLRVVDYNEMDNLTITGNYFVRYWHSSLIIPRRIITRYYYLTVDFINIQLGDTTVTQTLSGNGTIKYRKKINSEPWSEWENNSGFVESESVHRILKLTQAQYDQLEEYDENALYIII